MQVGSIFQHEILQDYKEIFTTTFQDNINKRVIIIV